MIAQVDPAIASVGQAEGHLLLAVVLSVVLKFVVDALRSVTNPKDVVSRAIPWITAGLGIVAGALDYFVGGAKLTDAIVLGGFGAGSTAVNELGKLIRAGLSKKEPPVETTRPGEAVETKPPVETPPPPSGDAPPGATGGGAS